MHISKQALFHVKAYGVGSIGNKLPGSREWYKERWPWFLMAGPLTVILAGSVTVWLAVEGADGLVADDYYKQGLSINQQLGRVKYAEEHNIQATLYKSGNNFRVFVAETAGLSSGASLVLKIVHPTVSGMDKTIQMIHEGAGLYTASLPMDLIGGSRRYVILEDTAGKWRLDGVWDMGEEGSVGLPNSNK